MSRVDTKSAQLFVPTPRGHAFWQVDVNERSVLGCFEKEGCVEAAGSVNERSALSCLAMGISSNLENPFH